MLPATASRVENATSAGLNWRFAADIEASVRHHAKHPEDIDRRLDELDHEWDIERTLEVNAATLGLTGTLLGAFVDRRFLVLPAVVRGFLLQHALQGWCPPVPVFRRLGVRTTAEIDRERTALKVLRGDFTRLDGCVKDEPPASRAHRAVVAASV